MIEQLAEGWGMSDTESRIAVERDECGRGLARLQRLLAFAGVIMLVTALIAGTGYLSPARADGWDVETIKGPDGKPGYLAKSTASRFYRPSGTDDHSSPELTLACGEAGIVLLFQHNLGPSADVASVQLAKDGKTDLALPWAPLSVNVVATAFPTEADRPDRLLKSFLQVMTTGRQLTIRVFDSAGLAIFAEYPLDGVMTKLRPLFQGCHVDPAMAEAANWKRADAQDGLQSMIVEAERFEGMTTRRPIIGLSCQQGAVAITLYHFLGVSDPNPAYLDFDFAGGAVPVTAITGGKDAS